MLPGASIRHAAAALVLCAGILLPVSPAAAFQRGFTMMGWTAGSYLTARAENPVRKMANAGSDHAAVFTQWFMDSPTSSTIAPDPQRTPSDAGIVHALELARRAGMATTLKPQVGIRNGAWIGEAHPADLDVFWADYRAMLLHYADLAEQNGVSMLVVGTEMATLSSDQTHWRALIAEVRQRFHGELTYAANYDEFPRVRFWDALDYIGIDAYFSLADASDPAPPIETLASAWTDRGYLARIAAISHSTGKKVLFTEIGYRGIHQTAVWPNRWDLKGATDDKAQANAYAAFYQAVADQPWMAGVYWWGVDVDKWWAGDYSPLGKPAEQVVAAWNKRGAPTPPPEPETQPAPVVQDPQPITAPIVTEPPPGPAPVTEAAPPPATPTTPPTPQPAANPVAPAIELSVRRKRVDGAVKPFTRACGGSVRLDLRRRSHGRWVSERPARPLGLSARGTFARAVRPGRIRARAVFSSRCANVASRWVAARV